MEKDNLLNIALYCTHFVIVIVVYTFNQFYILVEKWYPSPKSILVALLIIFLFHNFRILSGYKTLVYDFFFFLYLTFRYCFRLLHSLPHFVI